MSSPRPLQITLSPSTLPASLLQKPWRLLTPALGALILGLLLTFYFRPRPPLLHVLHDSTPSYAPPLHLLGGFLILLAAPTLLLGGFLLYARDAAAEPQELTTPFFQPTSPPGDSLPTPPAPTSTEQ